MLDRPQQTKRLKLRCVRLNCDVSRPGWRSIEAGEGLRRIFGVKDEEEGAAWEKMRTNFVI